MVTRVTPERGLRDDVAELGEGAAGLGVASAHEFGADLIYTGAGAIEAVADVGNVADFGERLASELVLDDEIPLLGVAEAAVEFDEGGVVAGGLTDADGTERGVEGGLSGIGGEAVAEKEGRGDAVIGRGDIDGDFKAGGVCIGAGEGRAEEDAVRGPDDGAGGAKWFPGEAEAGPQLLKSPL